MRTSSAWRTLRTAAHVALLRRHVEHAVFVVGCGRSGTTALCRALGEHPSIVMARGEAPLLQWLGRAAHQYALAPKATYYRDNTALGPEQFRRRLQSLAFDTAIGGAAKLPPSVRALSTLVRPRVLWAAKSFADERAATGLAWLFTNARFLYVFRNGIDVVHSMSRFHAFRGMSFDERCRFWSERAIRYDYLRRHPRALTVRFEELVERPAPLLHRIFESLGLPGTRGPAEFLGRTLIHPLDEPTRAASPATILRARPPAHLQWQPRERARFKSLCGDAMALLSYPIPY